MQIDPSMIYTREQVVANLRQAASTGPISFDFLLKQAEIESGLNPNAKASTSSAAGPFQFVNGTWLRMVEKHGDSVGLTEQASALRENRVDDAMRSNLLALRSDVQIATKLAARFAVDNANALANAGHTQIGPTELYLAHFLGAGGAAEFLNGMRANPGAPAATVLPDAARANKNVFFANGAPRSFAEIYDRFAQKFLGVSAPLQDGGAQTDRMVGQQQLAANLAKMTKFSKDLTTTKADLLSQAKDPSTISGDVPSLTDQLPQADGNAAMAPIDPARPDFNAIAQKAIAEARNLQNSFKQARNDLSELASVTSETADQIGTLTESALATYLASFSRNYEDPSKATLGTSTATARDASQGAETTSAAPMAAAPDQPTIAMGMRIVMDTTSPHTAAKAMPSQSTQSAAPVLAPAVRQAVQWVSLFSDPRGADASQTGRA